MKSLICSACVVASLALTGNAALAANTAIHTNAQAGPVYATMSGRLVQAGGAGDVAQARGPARFAGGLVPLAARGVWPRGAIGVDVAQIIQSALGGGPVQYTALVHDLGRLRGSGTGDSSGYVDTSVPDNSAAQEAIDAGVQANIQNSNDMVNEITLQDSMEAAQAQNDAANAQFTADMNAAMQTEINANQ
jgi:hypothetical protein